MNHLIVLCGPVGCGKSTFIKEFLARHSNFKHVDVFNYIQRYKDEFGHIEPDGSLKAHQELHQELEEMGGDIILELGTNREELNLNGLAKLRDKYKINIFFCLLETETCISRVILRATQNQKRIIHEKDLRKKFERVWPDNHVKIAQELRLPYNILDMNLSFEEKLKIIEFLMQDIKTVAAAIFIRDKKILLVKIKNVWIIPGGALEEGETEIECLNREISEEFPGLKLANLEFYNNFIGQSPNRGDAINVKVYQGKMTGEMQIKGLDEVVDYDFVDDFTNYNLSEITRKIVNLLRQDGYL
ncbi:MAG: NUDIX domain-containing protein [Candidatus Buchananbacteria bacterium]|jgi:ADP-ribose pyrophosphatase YjhB (NUDIX family)/predicted kinase